MTNMQRPSGLIGASALVVFGVVCGLGLLPVMESRAELDVQPDEHYELITSASTTSTPRARPEIVEIFNFKCPHCYTLHQDFQPWEEQNHARIHIQSMPVFWGTQSDLPARAFFAAQLGGKGGAMKTAIYKAHFDDQRDIEQESELVELAKDIGLDVKQFRDNLRSFAVATHVSQSLQLKKRYGVNSTPTLVINGTYRVMPGPHAGNNWQRLRAILDVLVTR
jgi:thiol:disulfide interchange protein DsbA